MSDTLKRYDPEDTYGRAAYCVPDPDGEWVRYDEAADRIDQLERELALEKHKFSESEKVWMNAANAAQAQLAAEKALAEDLDGCLQISEDIINAASKRLTKGKRAKWGLWYLETIAASRAAYRKARGL